ncbi:MAG TPA: thiamine pyrophosphate-dependent enzyme [Stellaceae bacterium]|nr:thiamine pyrophosphate-dependent enzyme [Stellaceae bacterium]
MLDRRKTVKRLLADRGDALIIAGLGSPTYDVAAAGDDERNFYLWGAMGGAAMMGLGLALARPERRVLVVTGDGEMLMGLGALATIAVKRPPNLAVVVIDNGAFGETGMQPSHTAQGANLAAIARGCGIAASFEVEDEAALGQLAVTLRERRETIFANVRVAATDHPRVLPLKDGVALKQRFRRALGIA